jgi:hypothetical protein
MFGVSQSMLYNDALYNDANHAMMGAHVPAPGDER